MDKKMIGKERFGSFKKIQYEKVLTAVSYIIVVVSLLAIYSLQMIRYNNHDRNRKNNRYPCWYIGIGKKYLNSLSNLNL